MLVTFFFKFSTTGIEIQKDKSSAKLHQNTMKICLGHDKKFDSQLRKQSEVFLM